VFRSVRLLSTLSTLQGGQKKMDVKVLYFLRLVSFPPEYRRNHFKWAKRPHDFEHRANLLGSSAVVWLA